MLYLFQMRDDRLHEYTNRQRYNIITVYPLGSHDGGDANGWNIDGNGRNEEGANKVCRVPRPKNQVYKCFDSCSRSSEGCNPQKGCNCASCMDDNQFIKDLLEHMKANFCVDL